MGDLKRLRERRDQLRVKVDDLAEERKKREASRSIPEDQAGAFTLGQELLTGALPFGFLAGFLGTLLFGLLRLMSVGPSDPAMVDRQGDLVLEGEGVVVAADDPSLLTRPFRVSVDPAADGCAYAIVVEGGPRHDGETSCETPLFDCGEDCVEGFLQVDGITESGYVRIDEKSGEVEVRLRGETDSRWTGAFARAHRESS